MSAVRPTRYAYSLPERIARAVAAAVGGATYETARLLLPRFVRGSKLYEVTAKNLLRDRDRGRGRREGGPEPRGARRRPPASSPCARSPGNVVELGSIAAFGFSPLWLLAGASDVAARLARVPRLARPRAEAGAGARVRTWTVGSVDDLLGVLEGGSGHDGAPHRHPAARAGRAARDRSPSSERAPEELPSAGRSSRRSTKASAARPRRRSRSLLEVSTGRRARLPALGDPLVGRDHVAGPYARGLASRSGGRVRRATRGASSAPYGRAVASTSTASARPTPSGLLGRLSRDV